MSPNPPIDELIEEDRANVGLVRVIAFTATPTSLGPGNSETTIHWSVQKPSLPRLKVLLNGTSVPDEGSRTFRQTNTASYGLTARSGRISRALQQLTVVYDTARCTDSVWSEQQIQALLGQVIASVIASHSELSLRSDPRIEVSSQGIECSIRVKRDIDNFPDLKVNLDCVLTLSVTDGQLVVRYRSFRVDVDWPWWVTTLSQGVTKIVEEVIDEIVEGALKPRIIDAIRKQIIEFGSRFPGFQLNAVNFRSDEIEVRVCPIT